MLVDVLLASIVCYTTHFIHLAIRFCTCCKWMPFVGSFVDGFSCCCRVRFWLNLSNWMTWHTFAFRSPITIFIYRVFSVSLLKSYQYYVNMITFYFRVFRCFSESGTDRWFIYGQVSLNCCAESVNIVAKAIELISNGWWIHCSNADDKLEMWGTRLNCI